LRLPEWQLVPGTRFVVDKFGGKAYEAAPHTKHWFLTHFHTDHYGGLGPRFKQGLPDVSIGMLRLFSII
jgi:glyoxylase-like metal-dependent hydrolase (beta-lactamase superfamily II)